MPRNGGFIVLHLFPVPSSYPSINLFLCARLRRGPCHVIKTTTGYPWSTIFPFASKCIDSIHSRERVHREEPIPPPSPLKPFAVGADPQVYTSSSNVVVLDHRLDLVETLQFWSALPHRTSSSSRAQVQGVLGNSKNGLVSSPNILTSLQLLIDR